jgi:hypothetical protein
MIRPLRSAHRRAFLALAILLPLLLASAWRARRAPVQQALTPELLPGEPLPDGASVADQLVYWSSAPAGDGLPLPPDAQLVGSVRSGALALVPPPDVHVLVYDLSHGRLVPAQERE